MSGVKTLQRSPNIHSNYAYYPVVFEEDFPYRRDEVCSKMEGAGIFPRKYFYPIVTEFSCYKRFNEIPPIALDISQRILCLPMYDSLDYRCVQSIISVFSSIT